MRNPNSSNVLWLAHRSDYAADTRNSNADKEIWPSDLILRVGSVCARLARSVCGHHKYSQAPAGAPEGTEKAEWMVYTARTTNRGVSAQSGGFCTICGFGRLTLSKLNETSF
jgi:hypothetical protein